MSALVRLKALRLERAMTQKQLSEFLGIEESSYQRLEYGKSRPHLDNVVKIADLFDISIDYLIGRSDDPNY